MDKLTIGGIVTLLIILSSGTTYYIQSIGEKTGCRAGWVYETQGEFEGYYKCITSTAIRYEMCFNVYNSANTENYWCEKGKIVKIEEQETPQITKVRQEICSPPPNYGCKELI